MTEEMAKLTLQFLQRVQLTGQEVEAYNAVQQAVIDSIDRTPTDLDAPDDSEPS